MSVKRRACCRDFLRAGKRFFSRPLSSTEHTESQLRGIWDPLTFFTTPTALSGRPSFDKNASCRVESGGGARRVRGVAASRPWTVPSGRIRGGPLGNGSRVRSSAKFKRRPRFVRGCELLARPRHLDWRASPFRALGRSAESPRLVLRGMSARHGAASPRLVATECPRRTPRRRRDSFPRNVHAARRGVAAIRPHGLSTSHAAASP